MPRIALGLALLLLQSLTLDRAAAQHETKSGMGTLAGCVEQVVNAARAQGARFSGRPTVDFLLTGDAHSHAFSLPEDGCFGLLAVGHRQVQHLGLALYAQSGRLLARDEQRDAHAYARFCGRAGRRFVAVVSMVDGQGEYQLVPLWNAPPALDALEPLMASCMQTGDRRPDLVDVGPEPLGRPIAMELSAVAKQLASQGYRPEGGVILGGLAERSREVRRVLLEGGQCYALAAVGDGDVEDIDMRLLSIAATTELVAADVTRQRGAVVKVCPDEPSVYALDVRMYRGGGNYVVQSFGLIESGEPLPAGLDRNTRIPYAEMLAVMNERGMRAVPVTWGLLRPGLTQSIPVSLRAGRCYSIGAIATSDFAGADLDMTLLGEGGEVQAAELGPKLHPLVFHCSDHDETVRVVLKGRELHRAARFLLLLGEPGTNAQSQVQP